ncbi:MAG TPA: hypothetical protein VJ842_13780 [Pyrinomonadaceae bacterium]|nr:hypothetical protein [Pyrinomonadaceae bacterium]
MANKNNRLKPSLLEADRNTLAALQAVTGYAPANASFSVAELTTLQAEMLSAQTAETQAAAALATARDEAVAKEWEYHNRILGVKDQVVAQFGRDSNEVQAIGLKKASERKAPTRVKKPAGTQP